MNILQIYINQTPGTRSVCCSGIRNSDQNNFKLCSQLIARTSGDCWGLKCVMHCSSPETGGSSEEEPGLMTNCYNTDNKRRQRERRKQNTVTCEILLLTTKVWSLEVGSRTITNFCSEENETHPSELDTSFVFA